MVKQLSIATGVLLAATTSLAAQAPVQFEHHTLGNGLEVFLVEDHDTPIVTVNVWYNVGSRDEQRFVLAAWHVDTPVHQTPEIAAEPGGV